MADRVLINLATGLEDSERVTVAFLVAGAALERGRPVAIFPHQGGGAARPARSRRRRRLRWLPPRWRGSSSSSRRAGASCLPVRSA